MHLLRILGQRLWDRHVSHAGPNTPPAPALGATQTRRADQMTLVYVLAGQFHPAQSRLSLCRGCHTAITTKKDPMVDETWLTIAIAATLIAVLISPLMVLYSVSLVPLVNLAVWLVLGMFRTWSKTVTNRYRVLSWLLGFDAAVTVLGVL